MIPLSQYAPQFPGNGICVNGLSGYERWAERGGFFSFTSLAFPQPGRTWISALGADGAGFCSALVPFNSALATV